VESTWNPYGMDMESIWNPHRNIPDGTHIFHMDSIWNVGAGLSIEPFTYIKATTSTQ
jgi:hypothetical protein